MQCMAAQFCAKTSSRDCDGKIYAVMPTGPKLSNGPASVSVPILSKHQIYISSIRSDIC